MYMPCLYLWKRHRFQYYFARCQRGAKRRSYPITPSGGGGGIRKATPDDLRAVIFIQRRGRRNPQMAARVLIRRRKPRSPGDKHSQTRLQHHHHGSTHQYACGGGFFLSTARRQWLKSNELRYIAARLQVTSISREEFLRLSVSAENAQIYARPGEYHTLFWRKESLSTRED